jgi:hypothetical protein
LGSSWGHLPIVAWRLKEVPYGHAGQLQRTIMNEYFHHYSFSVIGDPMENASLGPDGVKFRGGSGRRFVLMM